VGSREVILQMELAGEPTCTTATSWLGYCFLIDSDKNGTTGTIHTAYGSLGIDARICVEYDVSTCAFTSTLGTATVTTDPETGVATLEITTTVDQLPSIDFYWIAAAQQDSAFVRLPAVDDYGAWTTLERSMH